MKEIITGHKSQNVLHTYEELEFKSTEFNSLQKKKNINLYYIEN